MAENTACVLEENVKAKNSVDDTVKQVISEEALQLLSKGIKDLCEPDIYNVHERVKEVLRNQGVLRDSTQNELTQLNECSMLVDIAKTFENIKLHHKKLTNMRKDMSNLLERSEKTRIRAEKLKLQKEREELEIAQEKERQRKYEKELTAKPATEYSQNPSPSS